jgi:hypothetical protein
MTMIGGPMFPTLDNQWGDGAWIFWLFDRKSLTQFEICETSHAK